MTNDALVIVELLELFGPAYRRYVGEGLPQGVSPSRLRALAVLADRGPISMRELGAELQATAQNVTGLIDALEAEGVVTRQAHPLDRRVTLVALSADRGTEITQQRQAHRAWVARLFEILTEEERAMMAQCLAKLNAELQRR